MILVLPYICHPFEVCLHFILGRRALYVRLWHLIYWFQCNGSLQRSGDRLRTGSVKSASQRERSFAQKHHLFLQRNVKKVLSRRQSAELSIRPRLKPPLHSQKKTGYNGSFCLGNFSSRTDKIVMNLKVTAVFWMSSLPLKLSWDIFVRMHFMLECRAISRTYSMQIGWFIADLALWKCAELLFYYLHNAEHIFT